MSVLNNSSVTIDTVVPALSLGQVQLSADRRSTKEKPLSDAERIRRVVLPAGHWTEFAGSLSGERSQALTDLLRTALVAIGSDRLRDSLAADPMLRVLPLQDFTVGSLLAWNAESSAGRGSITFSREQVEAWLGAVDCATMQAFKTRHEGKSNLPALVAFVTARFGVLAAKNHGLRETADCDKLIALIDPADFDGKHGSLVAEVLGRLEHVKKLISNRAESSAVVSMEDL